MHSVSGHSFGGGQTRLGRNLTNSGTSHDDRLPSGNRQLLAYAAWLPKVTAMPPPHRMAASRVSELLGLRHPIIQGPFGGGLSSVELVTAVSGAAASDRSASTTSIRRRSPPSPPSFASDVGPVRAQPLGVDTTTSRERR